MFALLGLTLSCAAVLLIGCMATLRGREHAPRWAKAGWVVQSLFYTAFAALIFGVAILAGEIANASSSDYGLLEAVLAVLILGVTVFTWRLVRRATPVIR